MKSVLHFTSLISFFIYTARGQVGGYLYFELVYYENRLDKLADGGSCEIFGGLCDPYFEICIGLDETYSGCELLSYKTQIFENRKIISGTNDVRRLGNPLRKRFRIRVPLAVRVTITTMDANSFADSLISVHEDVLRINPFPNGSLSTSAIPIITLKRKDRGYNRVEMKVKVYSVCDKNVYGKFCERHCLPSTTYKCDDEGNKICLPGEYCEIVIRPTSSDSMLATAGIISNEWIWLTVGIITVILVVLFLVFAIYGRRRSLKAKRSVSRPQVVNEGTQCPFDGYEIPILSNPYDRPKNTEEISTGNSSQALSSNHAEYTTIITPNEDIYEEYVYQDYEKLEPVTTTQSESAYLSPDNLCPSQNVKISYNETQTPAKDKFGFKVSPRLPPRNLP